MIFLSKWPFTYRCSYHIHFLPLNCRKIARYISFGERKPDCDFVSVVSCVSSVFKVFSKMICVSIYTIIAGRRVEAAAVPCFLQSPAPGLPSQAAVLAQEVREISHR